MLTMESETSKNKKHPIFKEEAARLRAIWDATPLRMSQAEFGETYNIGGQSAVGNFLRGFSPLSLKAAMGFSAGLNVPIERFSTRLADQANALMQITEQADATIEPRKAPSRPGKRKYLVAIYDPSTEEQIGMVILQAESLTEAHDRGLRLIQKHQTTLSIDAEQVQTVVVELHSRPSAHKTA